jgi:hypothetical protein
VVTARTHEEIGLPLTGVALNERTSTFGR